LLIAFLRRDHLARALGASIGVAVLGREGAAAETLAAAHIVVPDVLSGLELLTQPLRLVATLRDQLNAAVSSGKARFLDRLAQA
jgi:hypothetical protein